MEEVEDPPPFGDGVALAWEEHEQGEYETHYLLVAQLKFDRQCEHGNSLIQRWRARQLVKVGICRAPCRALALGLPRMALSIGLVGSGVSLQHHAEGASPTVPLAAYRAAIGVW